MSEKPARRAGFWAFYGVDRSNNDFRMAGDRFLSEDQAPFRDFAFIVARPVQFDDDLGAVRNNFV